MFGEKRQRIDALDLSAIAQSAARRNSWSPDRTRIAENEYRKFLYLLMLKPSQTFTPWDGDLDLFWHEHILHTQQYAIDCKQLFNHFIHHDPSIANQAASRFRRQSRLAAPPQVAVAEAAAAAATAVAAAIEHFRREPVDLHQGLQFRRATNESVSGRRMPCWADQFRD